MNILANKKLLTIDDEEALRRSINIFFEDLGCIVFEADNGRAGVELVRREHPDVVLVDLRMPQMDGLEVIKILSEEFPDLPVIVVSGTGVMEDAIEAIREGAVDYITKPITDMQFLKHTVSKTLEKAELLANNLMYQEHLEELVEKRTAELRQAQKMEAIGTLAGGIAHDFNNILSGIMGFNELAMLIAKDENLLEYLRRVHQGAERARNLVHQILTFSKKNKSQTIPLQVSMIIKEALTLLRSSIPTTIEIKENIISNATIMADPSQVHQVIMNLCTNSFQAMEKKGGIMEVSLTEHDFNHDDDLAGLAITPGKYLDLMVRDNGLGMDTETRQRIFEPYFTTKINKGGTGLGLAVVHGIVGSYKGKITVQSETDQGTVFHVYLPIVDQKAVPLQNQSIKELSISGNERIIFVDDNLALINLAELAFTHYGYQINTFIDSQDALEEFCHHPDNYDLLITDMTMPRMTGDILAKKFLSIRPDLPVIVCSGYSEEVAKEKAQLDGIREYVDKPFVMTSMLKKVRGIFDNK